MRRAIRTVHHWNMTKLVLCLLLALLAVVAPRAARADVYIQVRGIGRPNKFEATWRILTDASKDLYWHDDFGEAHQRAFRELFPGPNANVAAMKELSDAQSQERRLASEQLADAKRDDLQKLLVWDFATVACDHTSDLPLSDLARRWKDGRRRSTRSCERMRCPQPTPGRSARQSGT
jgi:hypothetical protein